MSEIKDKLITAENLKNAYDDNKREISELKSDLVDIEHLMDSVNISDLGIRGINGASVSNTTSGTVCNFNANTNGSIYLKFYNYDNMPDTFYINMEIAGSTDGVELFIGTDKTGAFSGTWLRIGSLTTNAQEIKFKVKKSELISRNHQDNLRLQLYLYQATEQTENISFTIKSLKYAFTEHNESLFNMMGYIESSVKGSKINITEPNVFDANNAEINKIYMITRSSYVNNLPLSDISGGTLITFHYGGDSEVSDTQIYVDANGDLYYRLKWYSADYWIGWNKCVISKEYKTNNSSNNLISSFLKIGVVGDSLSSGECHAKNSSGELVRLDLYEHSWIQFIARKYGISAENFSEGGLSTKTWFSSPYGLVKLKNPDKKCNAYFIALGANDLSLGNNYVGTSSDINTSDSTQNSDTFYGNYGKIISEIKTVQPKAKIFLMTIPKPYDRYETTKDMQIKLNNAIKEIVNIFDNCYLLDLANDSFITDEFINTHIRNSHYDSVFYNIMGNHIADLVNNYMFNNQTEFLQVEFIGTDYSWYN